MSEKFDAIVVGSGMTGGWAAKELTEAGLKTLVLERGRNLEHPSPEYSDFKSPWELDYRNLPPEIYDEQGRYQMLKRKGWTYKTEYMQFFVDEKEYPYSFPKNKPFMWTRGYQVGGRSITWARQSYRWGPKDFQANAKDGHGSPWPISYEDLAPWYDYVEEFAGISGNYDGIDILPDGKFQPAWPMSCAEDFVSNNIKKNLPGRSMIIGRTANLTKPTEEQIKLGRTNCQARDVCMRGCTFGAYFNSLVATLPAAKNTGNLTLRADSIVESLEYDAKIRKITAVHIVDRLTKEKKRYEAKVIFLCASALGSVQILLNSKNEDQPNGLANSSNLVGKYIMDHFGDAGASGVVPGFEDRYSFGRRPTGIYIPNFRHEKSEEVDFYRGYGYQGNGSQRPNTGAAGNRSGIGVLEKERARKPAPWRINISMFGEILPYKDNQATIHPSKKDSWGISLLHLDCGIKENERKMIKQARKDAEELLKAGGCINVTSYETPEDQHVLLGARTHEMGGACMGHDPKTSVLNKWNQAHDISNLFITDGSCMSSTGTQNPSLTYMALTARAAKHAAELFKNGEL